jgi:hypothetical protein
MPEDRTIPFSRFVSLCQRFEGISSSNAMRDELTKYFQGISPTAVKYSSYFLLGRIGPTYEDTNLGISRITAVGIIAYAFGVSGGEVEG